MKFKMSSKLSLALFLICLLSVHECFDVLTKAKKAVAECKNSVQNLVSSTTEAVQSMRENAENILNDISSQEAQAYKIKDAIKRKIVLVGLQSNKKVLKKNQKKLNGLAKVGYKEDAQKLKSMKQAQRSRRNKNKALKNRKQLGVEKLMGVLKKPTSKKKLKTIVKQVILAPARRGNHKGGKAPAKGRKLSKKGSKRGAKRTTKSSTPSGSKIAETCLNSFMDSIPPTFCWKKGDDAGKIPSVCPHNWTRSLALCFQNCRSGYSLWGGICWEQCTGGRKNCGAVCGRGSCWKFWNWRAKKSYIPQSITNFDSRVGCPEGEYKVGAMCYRDCGKVGLTNCGIGACAADTSSCIKGIINMAIDFLSSLATFIGFIATFGAGGAAIKAATSVAKKVGQTVKKFSGKIKQAMNTFKRINKNPKVKKGFISKVTAKAKKYLSKEFEGKAIATVGDICSQVGDQLMTKVEQPPQEGFNWESVDLTGISSTVGKCKGAKSDSGKMECAGAILDMIAKIDPTGLAGMAAAFMKPVCEGV